MTAPHKATPEQWAGLTALLNLSAPSCLLELRDRLAAAEQRIQSLGGNSSAQQEIREAEAFGLAPSSSHPAKPDSSPAPAIAWARQLPVHGSCPPGGCDICQRDWPCARLAAERNSQPTPNPSQIRSSAPAGGLVERVQHAISHTYTDDARAAILAVADWLVKDAVPGSPHWIAAADISEEVERHG